MRRPIKKSDDRNEKTDEERNLSRKSHRSLNDLKIFNRNLFSIFFVKICSRKNFFRYENFVKKFLIGERKVPRSIFRSFRTRNSKRLFRSRIRQKNFFDRVFDHKLMRTRQIENFVRISLFSQRTRWTKVCFVWPSRRTRAIAWSSTDRWSCGSTRTTCCASVKFNPLAPGKQKQNPSVFSRRATSFDLCSNWWEARRSLGFDEILAEVWSKWNSGKKRRWVEATPTKRWERRWTERKRELSMDFCLTNRLEDLFSAVRRSTKRSNRLWRRNEFERWNFRDFLSNDEFASVGNRSSCFDWSRPTEFVHRFSKGEQSKNRSECFVDLETKNVTRNLS